MTTQDKPNGSIHLHLAQLPASKRSQGDARQQNRKGVSTLWYFPGSPISFQTGQTLELDLKLEF